MLHPRFSFRWKKQPKKQQQYLTRFRPILFRALTKVQELFRALLFRNCVGFLSLSIIYGTGESAASADKDGYPPRFVDQQGLVGSSTMLLYLHRDRRDQAICRSMVGTISDVEPRTATSTFTQLLSSGLGSHRECFWVESRGSGWR